MQYFSFLILFKVIVRLAGQGMFVFRHVFNPKSVEEYNFLPEFILIEYTVVPPRYYFAASCVLLNCVKL